MLAKCREGNHVLDARTRAAGGEVCFDCATRDEHTTRVIFRTYPKEGDVIAVLLDAPANPGYVACYQHVGQHGEGRWGAIVSTTRPARPEEYAALHKELSGIGYRLIIKKRGGPQKSIERSRARWAARQAKMAARA